MIEEIQEKIKKLLNEKKIAELRMLLNKLEPADIAILLELKKVVGSVQMLDVFGGAN